MTHRHENPKQRKRLVYKDELSKEMDLVQHDEFSLIQCNTVGVVWAELGSGSDYRSPKTRLPRRDEIEKWKELAELLRGTPLELKMTIDRGHWLYF